MTSLRPLWTGAVGGGKGSQAESSSSQTCTGQGLAACLGPRVSGEAKRLTDGQVGLNNKHGSAGYLGLFLNVVPLPLQNFIDATDLSFQTDLHKMGGVQKLGWMSTRWLEAVPFWGMICVSSAFSVTSQTSKCSSCIFKHDILSLVVLWKLAITLSLVSLRYCIPLVMSVRMLRLMLAGPKHQILRASAMSHFYSQPVIGSLLEYLVGRHLALVNILDQAVREGLSLCV